MAVVKINFISTQREKRLAAKAHVRYIQYRRGKDGQKTYRELFGSYGPMERRHAYAMIDQFDQQSQYFRIVLSPDPGQEDTGKDLLLPEITTQMMDLEEQLGQPIAWVAAVHADHTEKRHVHILAMTDVRLLPAVEMRQRATELCLEQRRERDLAREQAVKRERGPKAWERSREKD